MMGYEEGSKEYEEAGADFAVDLMNQKKQLQAEIKRQQRIIDDYVKIIKDQDQVCEKNKQLQTELITLKDEYLGQMRVIARSRITYKERVRRMVELAEQALVR